MRVSPRARPVADAPVDALLARSDELAAQWVSALILGRPLARIAELSLDGFAREAPALCAEVSRALSSEVELDQLARGHGGGGREPGDWAGRLVPIAGASDPRSLLEAVEALRGVIWEAVFEELRAPTGRVVAELADRLAYVCATVLTAALSAMSGGDAVAEVLERPRAVEVPQQSVDGVHAGSAFQAAPVGLWRGVLIDEHEGAAAPSADGRALRPEPSRAEPPRTEGNEAESAAPWEPQAGANAPIEIRDERAEDGSAAWIQSIEQQLERHAHDQLPFAVLLVDLGDPERLRRAAHPGGVESLMSQVEDVLARELHLDAAKSPVGRDWPLGSFTCERPGRYWLIVTETDVTAARRLAEWLVRAIRPLTAARWPRLEVTVGAAVCPDDGHDAAALAARAEIGVYAARAAGRSIAPVDEPAQ